MSFQTVTGQRIAEAGDLTATYFTKILTRSGITNTYLVPRYYEPFYLHMASVWVARPGGLNPDGLKISIGILSSDVGRNFDLIQVPQRCHYHLTISGKRIYVSHGVWFGCLTQGLAAGDILNFIAQIEVSNGK